MKKGNIINNYESEILKRVVSYIGSEDKHGIVKSIIITGSFGRHEETFEIKNNKAHLISDIEIGLVYDKIKNIKQLKRIINNCESSFSEELNLMPMYEKRLKKVYNYNYDFKAPSKITLFTYDLYKGSYTIFGEKIIENNKVELPKIDLYEAKKIVSNRIGELECKRKEKDLEEVTHWVGKVIMAIGTAWLITKDIYRSSYIEQYNLLLNNQKRIKQEIGEEFVKDYIKVFNKLRKSEGEYNIDEGVVRKYVLNINKIFSKLNLNKTETKSLPRAIKYSLKYIKNYGMRDFFGYEDKILQGLIDGYIKNEDLRALASKWYKILY